MTTAPRRNILLTIAYDGSKYAGWQIQPNAPTVQAEIEKIIEQLTQKHCRLIVAGRTDAGVHALGQIAHFYTESTLSTNAFFLGFNSLLPSTISICAVREMPLTFDIRRGNYGKHYRYTIFNRRSPSPQHAAYSWHIHKPLNAVAMTVAARHFVGTHDFQAFRAACCDRETTVRTMYRCTICDESPLVHIDVEGTAFLRNMVRIMAGTLVEVGQGKRDPESIAALLDGRDRTLCGLTAPPEGLSLVKVFLDEKVIARNAAEEKDPPQSKE